MLSLHKPVSHDHIEDLKDRLSECLIFAPFNRNDDSAQHELIRQLAAVVERVDKGRITRREAAAIFAQHRIPNFSFCDWRADMMDEGVYVEPPQQVLA